MQLTQIETGSKSVRKPDWTFKLLVAFFCCRGKEENGQLIFACDYKALKKITVPMSFPLLHLESVFNAIGDTEAKLFTNLDFRSSSWQVEISPCPYTKQVLSHKTVWMNRK